MLMCIVCIIMPRSFLMKNYFRRSDSKEEEIKEKETKNEIVQSSQLDLLSYPAEYLEYAASLLALSKSNWLQWDYELEKSYWFDTSTKIQNAESNLPNTNEKNDFDFEIQNKELIPNEEKSTLTDLSENIASNIACNQFLVHSENSNSTIKKELLNDTTNQFITLETSTIQTSPTVTYSSEKSSPSEKESPSELSTTSSLESTLDNSSAWEDNLDEKLKQMLGEDMEVVTRNIRQFLDNNRILVDEIAIETGLGKDSIKSFMDLEVDIGEENKKEFYKWYLIKVLRPTNENRGDESYTCYKCGKIFTYKSYLERHIKYVCPDSSGRTWKCSFCGKAFQYPCYLRRHIRSHTGESPYKCDKCDRAFVRSTDLQRHIRNHTGEKPYCCKQCSRAFARSTDLKRHMRTHTGEKPYKCWQCGKSFSQSGSLQTHLHTHNKEITASKNKKVKQGA